jgi:uncharacterized membrane protein
MTRKARAESPSASPPRAALAAALLAALIGLGVSLVLVRLHHQAHAGVTSACAINEILNCDKVATSPFSVVLGLPVAVWGALGFALTACLAAWGLSRRRLHAAWPAGLLVVLGAFSTAASLALALVSELLIGAWCLYCMGAWAAALALLVAAVVGARPVGLVAGLRADLRALTQRPRRTSGAVVLGLVGLGLLVVWYPRYWIAAPVVGPPPRPAGATGPAGGLVPAAAGAVVYSDYECPFCALAHAELKAQLAARPDIRVVKRHFPLDQACNPLLQFPMHQDACRYARAAICAEAQGHFHEMDDALFANQRAKRPVETLAAELGLDAAAFKACLTSQATELRLQSDIRAGIADQVKSTPTYLVGGVTFGRRLPIELFAPPAKP